MTDTSPSDTVQRRALRLWLDEQLEDYVTLGGDRVEAILAVEAAFGRVGSVMALSDGEIRISPEETFPYVVAEPQ